MNITMLTLLHPSYLIYSPHQEDCVSLCQHDYNILDQLSYKVLEPFLQNRFVKFVFKDSPWTEVIFVARKKKEWRRRPKMDCPRNRTTSLCNQPIKIFRCNPAACIAVLARHFFYCLSYKLYQDFFVYTSMKRTSNWRKSTYSLPNNRT